MSALVLAVVLATADRDAAERLYTKAEQEEHDLSLDAALADYEASVMTDPSNRWALRATARARWLRERSDGGFAPLERLERVRRDPDSQRNADTVDALARDLEAFPPGEVRIEARMFVAEAYATRLDRKPDAERELDELLDEKIGDPPIRAQAATRLVDMALARGDLAAAERAAARVDKIEPHLVGQVARWARRRVIERVAVSAVALFVIVAGVSAARGLRGERATALRRFLPRALAICVYLAIFAAVLANAYERGNMMPFIVLPSCVLPLGVLARAWALSGSTSPLARTARAALGAIAVAAAAFLVLDRIDVRYLESFGL